MPGGRATSAGGVVLRQGGSGPELVLGRRRRDRDTVTWSLPKGTPDGDETIEQTALREVEEETGLQVRILAPVGPIEYWFVQKGTRIHKTVHYYLMETVGGDLSLHDHEFDEVRWVSLADAEALMSFATEREVVARAVPLSDQRVTDPAALRQTPLHAAHVALGARLIDFGGWSMPVQYRSILEEHAQVRRAAGLFDLSHMGELWVDGPGAGDGLAYALVSDPRTLAVGRAQYSMICAPDGGIIDDLIVYRVAPDRFLVVPNASNAAVVSATVLERLAGFEATLDDASDRTALVAVQGPWRGRSWRPSRMSRWTGCGTTPWARAAWRALRHGSPAPATPARMASRCSSTTPTRSPVWDALLARSTDGDLRPCGLGARDTLRLEAGMPLYGNELDRDCTPAEAGLGRVVKPDKPGGFVGREALLAAAAVGARKQLVGLQLRDPGIARHGYPLYLGDEPDAVGVVTSGSLSPTLGVSIAMGWLPPDSASVGTMVQVGIRASRAAAEVVALPFYRRPG